MATTQIVLIKNGFIYDGCVLYLRGVAHSISHGSPREKSEKKSEKSEKFGQTRNFEKTEKF